MATVIVPLTFGYCGGDPLSHCGRGFRHSRRRRSRVDRSCRAAATALTVPPTTLVPSRPPRSQSPPPSTLGGSEQKRSRHLSVTSLHTKDDNTHPILSRYSSIGRSSVHENSLIGSDPHTEYSPTSLPDVDTRPVIHKYASIQPDSPTKPPPEHPILLRRSSSIRRGILNSTEPMNPMFLLCQQVRRQSLVDGSPPQPILSLDAHFTPLSREDLEKMPLSESKVLRKVYQGANIFPKNWAQFGPRSQSPEPIEFHDTSRQIAEPESPATPDPTLGESAGNHTGAARSENPLRLRSTTQVTLHSARPKMSNVQMDLQRFCKQTTFHGRHFQVLDIESITQQFEIDELPFELDGTPLIYSLPNAIAATDYGIQDPWESTVDPARCLEEDDPMGLKIFEIFADCVEFCIMLHGCLVLLMGDPGRALSQQRKYPHRFGGLAVFYAKYDIQYTASIFSTDSELPSIFSHGSFLESITTIGTSGSDLPFLSSSGDIWVPHTNDLVKQGKAFVKVRSKKNSEMVGVVIPTHLLIPPPTASLSALFRSRKDIRNLASTDGTKVYAQKACKESFGSVVHCFDHEATWPKGTLLKPASIQTWALESLRHDQSLIAVPSDIHNPNVFDEFANPATAWYDRESLPYNEKLHVVGDLPELSRAIGTDSHRHLFGAGALMGQKLRKCLTPKLKNYDIVLQRSFLYRRLTKPTTMEGLSGAAVVTLTKKGAPKEIVGMQQGVLLCGCDGDDRDEDSRMVEKRLDRGASSVYVMKPPCYQLKKDYELVKEELHRNSDF
ncbi:MAG: hypothetical protein M1813_002083 [Trichoglossum hirsutum]|nr:MAG: hypothetical protein M1813_002083 [Trichoglossum hirsutum]